MLDYNKLDNCKNVSYKILNKISGIKLFFLYSRWLPTKYREDQTNFFGKRGVTWHITVVSRKKQQDLNSIDMTDDVQEEDDFTINDQEQTLVEK